MNDMQQAIMAEIDNMAGPGTGGLKARHVPQYANTGQVYIQRGFTTLVRLGYDFQSNYLRLHVADLDPAEIPEDLRKGVHPAMGPAGANWQGWMIDYDKGPEIDRMLAALAALVRSRAGE